MPTMTIARKELERIVQNLPDDKVMPAVEFMRRLDPFYGESNMKHLRAVKKDVSTGHNMSPHDLIEADDV